MSGALEPAAASQQNAPKAVKAAIEHYVDNPRPLQEIRKVRAEIVALIKASPRPGPESMCNIITPDDAMVIVRELATRLFSREISEILLNGFTTGQKEPDCPAAAMYDVMNNTVLLCCNTIRKSLPELDAYGDVQLSDQEYRFAMDPVEKMVLVIEHEFIHFLMHKAKLKGDDSRNHGAGFVNLSRNLFNQGRGDLALTLFPIYMKNPYIFFPRMKQLVDAGVVSQGYITGIWNLLNEEYPDGVRAQAAGKRKYHRALQKTRKRRMSRKRRKSRKS